MLSRSLFYIALLLALANLFHEDDPAQALPLVHADYQRCVKVQNAPLERPMPLYPGRKNVA